MVVPAVPREATALERAPAGELQLLGAPPQSGGPQEWPREDERIATGRLFLGIAGFAILALFNLVWLRVDAPSNELSSLVSSVVHGLGLALAAAGLTGLRTPTAALAGAVTGVAGLVVLCMPLLGIFGFQSLTATQLSHVVKDAALTLVCVTSAAVGLASAARLGPIRVVVAVLWSIAAIPAAERSNWILQEKIVYEPGIKMPTGEGVKAEVRMMFLRAPDEAKPTLVLPLVRLSRGKMLGVDQNRDLTWVGGTVGIWPAD